MIQQGSTQDTLKAPEPLLTVDEVQAILRVSKSFLYDHTTGPARPHLRCVKVGRRTLVKVQDLNNFIEEWCQ